jgi:hypothetical protein
VSQLSVPHPSDWAAERTNFPSEVAEMTLAHAISDKTEKAYRRGDLFDRRRRLMTAWEEFALAKGQPPHSNLAHLHHTGLWRDLLFLSGNFLERSGDGRPYVPGREH